MSDIAGAAPAAADSPSVPEAVINDSPAGFNQPLGSQIPADAQSDPKADKAPPSIDDSIDRAMAKSDAKAKEPAKVEARAPVKEPAKVEQPRENGKFTAKVPDATAEAAKPTTDKTVEAAKPSYTAGDPPARFTDTAKQKWASADPEIRGEVSRMERELTQGFEKHRKAAERDASLAEFHDMAEKQGTDVKTALSRYVNIENVLKQDLVKGLEEICSNRGLSLRDVAAHVLGQTPEQNASAQDATIREMKQTIADLQKQVGGVTQSFQQQRTEATTAEVTKFAADHPRFDELSEDIAFFLKTRTKDLSEAYTLAERLNPAPAQASTTAASSAPNADQTVQTDKGQKSINGAPATGVTTPTGKKRAALSLDEALDRAFAQ